MPHNRIIKQATILVAGTVLAMAVTLVAAQAAVADKSVISAARTGNAAVVATWTQEDRHGRPLQPRIARG